MHLKSVIAREHGGHRRRYVATLLWMFLGFLYVSLASQWFTVNRRDKLFAEYTYEVIQTAANEQRPAKEVRDLLLVKAEDLLLPVHEEEIHITGKGPSLRAAVLYKTDITVPIINQPVHRMWFNHDLTLKPPR